MRRDPVLLMDILLAASKVLDQLTAALVRRHSF